MNTLNKTEFAIFIALMWSLLPSELTNQNILNVTGLVLSRVAAVKRLLLHHYSAAYISSGVM